MPLDPEVLARMRDDWNQRAQEDAKYYVAFGRRDQDDEEFFASAADVARSLIAELRRVPARGRALEIGCGPGRLLRPMSAHFTEVHGVDVSDEMIRMAREKLRAVPNAFPRHTSGSDLQAFPDAHFDFVYSYAVFQHIPSRDVVFSYLAEARRVLTPGGILRCQLNGLPKTAAQYTTWSGVRISADEVAAFAREQDLQLLALEGIDTQYMWATFRKRSGLRARIHGLSNANTGEPLAPASGPYAAASLWIEHLPEAADLNTLTVRFDGKPGRCSYIGPPDPAGIYQLNVALPEGLRTGLVPVDVEWLGAPLAPTAWLRIIPPGPAVPRIKDISDGVNLCAGVRVASGTVKISMEEVTDPSAFTAALDGRPLPGVDWFRTDPITARYEFNLILPTNTAPGGHSLELALGKRQFAPIGIEVV